MRIIAYVAGLLPVYLYSIMSRVSITLELLIAFTLISLLSTTLVIASALLSVGKRI